MKITEININNIHRYENNPRINDDAVDAVAASIQEFGWKQPIVVDEQNTIIAGHTRYKAALKLGLTAIPCVVASDLNEEQIRAYRLADNRVGELSTWDFGSLDIELAGIADLDMSQFGFLDEEMNISNIDIDGLFEESTAKEKEPKTIVCPNCGEKIEI